MKLFYLVDDAVVKTVTFGYHGFDLENGKHLLCVNWTDELEESRWANTPGVSALPHPIFEAGTVLADEHVAHLGKFNIEKGHNVHHVIKAASKIDIWMRLHVL